MVNGQTASNASSASRDWNRVYRPAGNFFDLAYLNGNGSFQSGIHSNAGSNPFVGPTGILPREGLVPEQFGRHRHVSHLPDDDTVKMRRPKKRVDVIWIAIALTFGAGGADFTIASSSADHNHAGAAGGEVQITTVDDAGLGSNDPPDEEAAAKLAIVTGVPAATAAAPQTWKVGEASVLGYEAADGRFCFEFRKQAGVLTEEQSLDVTTDYGARHVPRLRSRARRRRRGHAHGRRRAAAGGLRPQRVLHGLGGTKGTSGVVIATMSDGTTRAQPLHISSFGDMLGGA